ncbi:MAG: phosphoribosylformylglycinamidine synthase subunit PurS [Acidobacteria bacterium]|nr:phosphoribosylformylglycinamidine synthase subunit PurS [Acidobacteriota bacterium]
MKVKVIVRLKKGVLDPQGKAIEKTAARQGFEEFNGFRLGKIIEFQTDETDRETVLRKAGELADKFLANTVIENYEVQIEGD